MNTKKLTKVPVKAQTEAQIMKLANEIPLMASICVSKIKDANAEAKLNILLKAITGLHKDLHDKGLIFMKLADIPEDLTKQGSKKAMMNFSAGGCRPPLEKDCHGVCVPKDWPCID